MLNPVTRTNAENTFKELLHIGLGSVVVVKEKIKEELKILQEKGKINSTGNITRSLENEITKRGVEAISLDYSEEMLRLVNESAAQAKAVKEIIETLKSGKNL
jgi:hypothetical protein